MKYIHIFSNVIFGGGEQVMITLCKHKADQNFLYLLRESKKIPVLKNIDNTSIFKAKDVYTSMIDHLGSLISIIYIILKIKFKHKDNFSIVFHGFPCQFLIILTRLIYPNKTIYMIYHQIKHNHKGLKYILRVIENLIIYFSKPIIGAPSFRALDSIKNYCFKFVRKEQRFFEFKNCFSRISYNQNSYQKFKDIILDKPFFLTVGRFEDFKGHLRLLKFIENNVDLRNNFNFILVGNGKNYESCKYFKNKHNLKNVKFLGSQNRDDLFHLYQKSIGVILPSYEESFGVSIIEALSFNKVLLVFENSLLIDKNIKLINPKSIYTRDQIIKLLDWNPNGNNSLIYNTDDTMASLKNFLAI